MRVKSILKKIILCTFVNCNTANLQSNHVDNSYQFYLRISCTAKYFFLKTHVPTYILQILDYDTS